jgi:ParB family chromosome partitioning protein
VESGLFYTVAGERRCAAARKAGLTTIPAIYTDNPNYEEIALAENTIRADLTAVEEAEALDRLQKSKGYRLEDMAKVTNRALSTIAEILSINRLPQSIRNECRKNTAISKRTLIGIAARKQERGMLAAYEAYKASVNPDKKERTGETPTKTQSAVKALEAAQKRIAALEVRELYVEEKEALTAALTGMKGAVETLLAAIAEPDDEEAEKDKLSRQATAPETTTTAATAAKKKKKVV